MDIETEIFINQVSQGLISITEIENWLNEKDIFQKRTILKKLAIYIKQTGLTSDKLLPFLKSKEKPSPQIQILWSSVQKDPLGSSGLSDAFSKISNLNERETLRSFLLLTSILSLGRSNEKIKEKKSHQWWKEDLSNIDYVNEIIEKHKG